MNELYNVRKKAQRTISKIHKHEDGSKKLQGDISSLELTAMNAVSALNGQEEAKIVFDTLEDGYDVYKRRSEELAHDWDREEKKRKEQLDQTTVAVDKIKRSIQVLGASRNLGMAEEYSRHEFQATLDIGLSEEIIDILTGGDPSDLLHSACYEAFVRFIKQIPIKRELMKYDSLDTREVLSAMVWQCRFVGLDEEQTVKYIIRNWKMLCQMYEFDKR